MDLHESARLLRQTGLTPHMHAQDEGAACEAIKPPDV